MLSSTKICAAVLAFSGAAVAVSNLQASPSPMSGGPVTLTWSAESSDTSAVTLVVYSTNPTFNGPFAIANNINPQDKKAMVDLPDLMPAGGYSFGFVSMSDTSKVVATSPEFAIPAPGQYTTPAKPTTTSSHVWISSESSMKPTPASVAQSAASAASHSGSSAVHSRSSVPVASVSRSIVASLTVPFPSASASALSHTVVSFTSTAPSISATTPTAHSSTAPSASSSARTGGALSVRVPAVGLAAVIGGLLVGAWAV